MADPKITVLYADAHLAIVDKPAGMLVVSAPNRRGPTLVDVVGRQLGARAHAVHRLDEETTGAIAIALDHDAKAGLETVFRERLAERVYLALVLRMPSPQSGRISSKFVVDGDGMVKSVRGGRGERAITTYRALERRGSHVLVECRLETGRRNQIRVHMAELGCSVVGDRKYGERKRRDGGLRASRPLLHAESLAFDHPLTGAQVAVTCVPREPELRRTPRA